ncbi:MAG: prohibitin family protein [Oscillospiraceae bacterium]|nr:prohibitin family protein [Oscillospiraceae bacterium]
MEEFKMKSQNHPKKVKKIISTSIIGIIALVLLFNAFRIVPAGHTGVRLTMGRVTGTTNEGLVLQVPFVQSIVIMDNRITDLTFRTEAVTGDLQAVTMTYTVNYFLNPDMSGEIFRTIGVGFESVIVRPTVEEIVKDITARYTIEELITERARVSADITSSLQSALGQRGLTFERFNIVDFSFSEEFSNAIEAVRVAEQNALRAEQDLERVRFEAEQEVARAEAQAEVLRLQAQELTDTNLQAMWIETWDGVLPQVMTDSSGLLINFGN